MRPGKARGRITHVTDQVLAKNGVGRDAASEYKVRRKGSGWPGIVLFVFWLDRRTGLSFRFRAEPGKERIPALLLLLGRKFFDALTENPQMPERVAQTRHAVSTKLLHGKNDACPCVAHGTDRRIDVTDGEL